MLFSLGHGQKLAFIAAADSNEAAASESQITPHDPDIVSVARAVPDAGQLASSATESALESALESTVESEEAFGYLFPDAAELPGGDKAAALAALAAAMIEAAGDPPAADAEIAPIMTYFGQFIDHDITAGTNTDAVTKALRIANAQIVPQNRSLIVAGLKNLRKGSLGLDSVYGDGPISGPMSAKLEAALRDPLNSNKMRLGELTRLNDTTPPSARVAGADNLLDLPRVGAIVGSTSLQFPTTADLPEELRPKDLSDQRWNRRAFIGDSRNDENLILAQTHLAFLRLHNVFVDRGNDFAAARKLTTWHYQWLIVNEFLPAISHAETLAAVIASAAPLYKRFYDARKSQLQPGSLPMPLEFSAAAFRFGHSMVRAAYDYNSNFNFDGPPGCPFSFLFAFTGNHATPIGFGRNETLPDNWPIDWARFIDATGPANRRARAIDTHIAPPLFTMVNEVPDAGGLFQRLAERNLKRGHLLNLPTAQALIAKLASIGLAPSATLSAAQIASGRTFAAVTAGGFDKHTPLWFYVLKEAEILGLGGRLGPLGTRIVAETLVGLLVQDASSFWAADWTPEQGADGHAPIRSFADLFRAAGVL